MRVRQNPNKKNKSPLYDRCWRAASFFIWKITFRTSETSYMAHKGKIY